MYLLLKAKVKVNKKSSNHFTLAKVKQSKIELKVKVEVKSKSQTHFQ